MEVELLAPCSQFRKFLIQLWHISHVEKGKFTTAVSCRTDTKVPLIHCETIDASSRLKLHKILMRMLNVKNNVRVKVNYGWLNSRGKHNSNWHLTVFTFSRKPMMSSSGAFLGTIKGKTGAYESDITRCSWLPLLLISFAIKTARWSYWCR